MEEDSGSSSEDPVIETLRSRGWCLKDWDQVKAIVMIHSALADDGAAASSVVDSVESELSNMDLKSIGAKSLPEPSIIRKSSHLVGPKVLQISSMRDVSRSSIQDLGRNSGGQRLLRLGLTDGVTEITAIEFSHVPAIPDDVVPGTKVRLEKKATIRSGLVCLNPKVITLIGGVVPSLYEEWQMNRKYSGFSRSSLRLSKESDYAGPPPFEKLQIGGSHRPLVQKDYAGSNSKNGGPTAVKISPEIRPTEGKDNLQWKASGIDKNKKPTSPTERTEDKPSSSVARPGEDYAGLNSKNGGPKRTPEIRPTVGKNNLQWKASGIDKNKKPTSPTERTEEKPSSSVARPKEDYAGSNSKNGGLTAVKRIPEIRPTEGKDNLQWKASGIDKNKKPTSPTERTEEKPSSSVARPKEDYAASNSKNGWPTAVKRTPEIRPTEGKDNLQWKANGIDKNKKPTPPTERTEEKPSSSVARPKEVAEYVPIQNQAASQKLLQKLNNQNKNGWQSKGRKCEWKEKQEESSTLTLDEWERGKAGAKLLIGNEHPDISRDEDLAWQLQNQFDLEDSNVQRGPYNVDEDIRMSMFNYNRDDNRVRGTEHEGGRRGRGRGSGRGRGRGQGK